MTMSGNDFFSTACSSSCSSYGQHLTNNNATKNVVNIEKEPIPPKILWNSSTLGLALLYVTYVWAAAWILPKAKRIHLSTQLRF